MSFARGEIVSMPALPEEPPGPVTEGTGDGFAWGRCRPASLDNLSKLAVSVEAVRALPADFVKAHRVLPFEIREGTLHVASSEPGNLRVLDDTRCHRARS